MTQHLTSFIDEMRSLADAAETLLASPGTDDAHTYVEAVSLAARAKDLAGLRAEHMAYTAHQAPVKVSIPRLAKATRVSVNTLRSRLPRIGGSAKTDAEPFNAF